MLILSHAGLLPDQPISARPFRGKETKRRKVGRPAHAPWPLVTIRIFLFSCNHFTSPHHIPQVVFADCRLFSSLLPRVFQFSTRFLLIAFFFRFQLCFGWKLQRVAVLSRSALSSTFFSGSTESASIPSAQHLYHRCRHTIPIISFHDVVQRDRYPEGAAVAQLRAPLWHPIMAYLRQGLYSSDGLSPAGLRLPASSYPNVDVEGGRLHDCCILYCNFWGKGVNSQPSSVQAELALHDPQLLPYEHQCDFINAVPGAIDSYALQSWPFLHHLRR